MPPVQMDVCALERGRRVSHCSTWNNARLFPFRNISRASHEGHDGFTKACHKCNVCTQMPLTDKFGRAITDLRVSITDRCNYKCVYCRTGNEGAQFADLSMADYLRMVRVLVSLGIEKVRLTGGEPLLRKGVVEFVEELSALRTL